MGQMQKLRDHIAQLQEALAERRKLLDERGRAIERQKGEIADLRSRLEATLDQLRVAREECDSLREVGNG